MAWTGRMIGPKFGEVHKHGTEAAERIADFGVLEEKDCRLDTVQVQVVVGCSCCYYNAMETLISVAPADVPYDHVADPNTAVGESREAEVHWSPSTRRP